MRSKWLVFGAILISLSGCKTAEQALLEKGVKPMHETQLREEIIEKTLYGENAGGRRWAFYIKQDGTSNLKWLDNGSSVKSKWTMKDFNSCFINDGENAGIPYCYTMYKDGDSILAYRSGKIDPGKLAQRIFRIEQGNTQGL